MDRRRFLKSSVAAGLLQTTGGFLTGGNVALADFPILGNRVLVNMMLFGGPDFRYLMPPAFDPDPGSFAFQHWENYASVHQIAASATDYEARWNSSYFPVNDGATQFGILNSCGWLKRMWDDGNVAIICNALGGTTRDHAHCQLQMDQGDLTSGRNDQNRSGWGGRLAAATGGNVLALTAAPRYFCYGPHPTDPLLHDNSNLIAARNTREMALYRETAGGLAGRGRVISRSLESYYAAKSVEMDPASIYRRFVDHENTVRQFGDTVGARLSSVPMDPAVAALTQGALNDAYLGQQIQNLHDSFLSSDLIDLRVASLEHGGFDSHQGEKDLVEPMFEDLFGDGKAFDALYQSLPVETADQTVLVVAGEFGRQIRGNGAAGADHGEGNCILLIGSGVQGGIYGDMFPVGELERLNSQTPHITGLTSIEHIFGTACDWVTPASGDIVFPRRASAPIEAGLSLQNVFA